MNTSKVTDIFFFAVDSCDFTHTPSMGVLHLFHLFFTQLSHKTVNQPLIRKFEPTKADNDILGWCSVTSNLRVPVDDSEFNSD